MRIDAAGQAARLGLTYEGPCAGGEVGAGYVRWPDGRRGVLSEGDPARAPLLAIARAAGIPAPSYDLVDGRIVVQSRLPGHPPTRIDGPLVEAMTGVARRFTGLLRDCETPPLQLYLHQPGPGFCRHDTLAGYSPRSAALLDTIRRAGAALPDDRLPGDDLVHLDYHPGNVLVDDFGAVTGVVDWDGAGRGNRAFDLVTLLFSLRRHAPGLAPALAAEAAALAPAPVLAACWAHMSLRQVDWSIRFHAPAEVEAWLTVAEHPPF